MLAVPYNDLPQTDVASKSPLSQMALLHHLRFVAMACRAKPKTSLFEACALLHVTHSAERDAYADALMRCLSEALGRPTKLFAPGTHEITFDEKWLMQLSQALATQDEASSKFLLNSRVSVENRRLVRFLMAQISQLPL